MRQIHSPLGIDGAAPSDRSAASPTYRSYLEVDRLLELQRPLSTPEHPDELHFIVTHQAMELWFKILIHELGRARADLECGAWASAFGKVKRVNSILSAQTAQMGTLGHLDPKAFLEFRGFLGTASGFQSVQFRVIEVLSGLREPGYLDDLRARHDGSMPAEILDVLSEASLAEVAAGAAKTAGVKDWLEVYSEPDVHGALFLLGEALLDYDRLWMLWRYEHLLLVERIIGHGADGTGGASARYLEQRLSLRFFPFLWDVRYRLTMAAARKGNGAR
ncbi:tryptophan 2,3-dioxygenase family protein [Amycolatopsis rhizosphaerae]|nr:tryptophan 2,3-dioxygenase family protein [Amycolatopsis rhizosphaerae]